MHQHEYFHLYVTSQQVCYPRVFGTPLDCPPPKPVASAHVEWSTREARAGNSNEMCAAIVATTKSTMIHSMVIVICDWLPQDAPSNKGYRNMPEVICLPFTKTYSKRRYKLHTESCVALL